MVLDLYDMVATIEQDETLAVRFSSPTTRDSSVNSARSPVATKEAVLISARTLRDRLFRFRILCIAGGLISLLCLIGSVIFGIWMILAGALALFTLCGLFNCRDLTRVNRWQQDILNLWVQDRLELDAFSKTILPTPGVSQGILHGMLNALPTRSRGFPPMAPNLRNATALSMRILNRCMNDRMALVTLAYSTAVGSLAWAASTWSSQPVAGCLLVPLVLGVLPVSTDLRLRHWRRQIPPLVRQGVDRREFVEVARRLDWGPIPSWKKDRWLEALIKESS